MTSPPVDSAPAPLPDAAPAAPRCDPAKPFGAPVKLANISSTTRDQGAILLDELTLMFASDRSGTADLYIAKRATPTADFAAPTALANFSSPDINESGPTVTADGLTLYYVVEAKGGTDGNVYVSHRASSAADFPVGAAVSGVNTASDEEDPSITPDGTTLYFDSAGGTTMLHLYSAADQGGSPGLFGASVELGENAAGFVDSHPHPSPDGLTLYWTSTRTTTGAQGNTDIWMATRAKTSDAFGTASDVTELNSTSNESLSWISADGCQALLQSDRAPTLGAQDIYLATRPM